LFKVSPSVDAEEETPEEVASFADAWIEIRTSARSNLFKRVASLTDAWTNCCLVHSPLR
jgi:hypothetical protein